MSKTTFKTNPVAGDRTLRSDVLDRLVMTLGAKLVVSDSESAAS